MNILYAMLGGFALDWLFGDPAWLTASRGYYG